MKNIKKEQSCEEQLITEDVKKEDREKEYLELDFFKDKESASSSNSVETDNSRNPWSWIPTLYFAQGLPYVAVMTISVIMYKRLGISNTDIALYTGWLYLPWVIKPFWSPFVDIVRTKRWWTLAMQWIMAVALAGIAFAIPAPMFFQLTLAVFWLLAFTSATHDIAADGFYMLALTEHQQSLYVGIRSTFYRIATVAGQGLLVVIAGLIETSSGLDPIDITVNADPSAPFSKTTTEWVDDAEAGLQGEMQFIASAPRLNIATSHPSTEEYQQYVADMRQKVLTLNASGGFYGAEGTQIVENYNGTAAPNANNIGVVAVKLNKAPKDDETIVLNFTHKSGDQSIKMEQNAIPARFEFNAQNWNKPAYLIFEVDGKLQKGATATFRGASGNIPLAWMTVFLVLSAFFFAVALYHSWALPKPKADHSGKASDAAAIVREFLATFKSFFSKPQIWAALGFMLLYRLPEAQLVKLINPFLLDPIDKGGLGLTTGQVGITYGTVGILGLTLGGIIGGIAAAKGGLRKWLKPMAWSMSLTCLTFVYLSYATDPSLLTINICVFIEQFGYGFGFTAYMLFLIYFSEGRYKTAHYAICTGFMALGMMLPGMAAGWLEDTIGYRYFFIWTMICCAATIGICEFLKIDPNFGKKTNK